MRTLFATLRYTENLSPIFSKVSKITSDIYEIIKHVNLGFSSSPVSQLNLYSYFINGRHMPNKKYAVACPFTDATSDLILWDTLLRILPIGLKHPGW